jgi:uncharacterized protein
MHLTRAALPAMLAAGAGTVINVASTAGLVPGLLSTYSASKAWVVAFTEALVGMDKPKLPPFLWLGVDAVVSMSLADIARGKVISVPGVPYKAIAGAGRMTPRGLALAVTKRVGGHGRT